MRDGITKLCKFVLFNISEYRNNIADKKCTFKVITSYEDTSTRDENFFTNNSYNSTTRSIAINVTSYINA